MSYDRIYNFYKDKKGFVLENIKNSWQKKKPHKICHLYSYIHTYGCYGETVKTVGKCFPKFDVVSSLA